MTITTGTTPTEDAKVFPAPPTTPYILAIVSITALAIGAIVMVLIFQPTQRDQIGQIIAFATPIVAGFSAIVYGMMNMHRDLNSRLSQLVAAKMAEALAQGRIDERAGTPEPTSQEIAAAKMKL